MVPKRIGFMGLGAMGYPMAAHLRAKLPKDTSMVVFDVVPEVLSRFATETGASPALDAEEVVEQSDVIVTMVPEGAHVRAIFTPSLLALPLTGKLFLECSTIDIETSKHIASLIMDRGADFVDAPVSGGPSGAKAGTLTIMMGYARGHPREPEIMQVLSTMGGNLVPCGGPSLGLVTKLCNNYVSGTIAIATAEGYNLAMRLGLDPWVFNEVLKTSSAGSWVNDHVNPVPGIGPSAPSSNDYAGGFKVQLMKKDYGLAVAAAQASDTPLRLGAAGLDVYSQAAADPRCVDRDSRVVYRFIGGREDWMRGQH